MAAHFQKVTETGPSLKHVLVRYTVLVEVLKSECYINSTAIYLLHRSNRILLDKSILHSLVAKCSGGVNTKTLMF